MRPANSRRDFIKGSFFASFNLLVGGLLLSGCKDSAKPSPEGKTADDSAKGTGSKDACDMTRLTAEDKAARKSLGYVEKSPMREKKCRNCKLFVPPAENKSCGSCPLFKGPIRPEGYCTYWAAKNA